MIIMTFVEMRKHLSNMPANKSQNWEWKPSLQVLKLCAVLPFREGRGSSRQGCWGRELQADPSQP